MRIAPRLMPRHEEVFPSAALQGGRGFTPHHGNRRWGASKRWGASFPGGSPQHSKTALRARCSEWAAARRLLAQPSPLPHPMKARVAPRSVPWWGRHRRGRHMPKAQAGRNQSIIAPFFLQGGSPALRYNAYLLWQASFVWNRAAAGYMNGGDFDSFPWGRHPIPTFDWDLCKQQSAGDRKRSIWPCSISSTPRSCSSNVVRDVSRHPLNIPASVSCIARA